MRSHFPGNADPSENGHQIINKHRNRGHPHARYDAEQMFQQVDLQARVLHPARQIQTNKTYIGCKDTKH